MGKKRIVITGVGVVASNAIGKDNFYRALHEGKSGIKKWKILEDLNMRCQIGGSPDISTINMHDHFPKLFVKKVTNKAVIYGCLAGMEAWKDAGLSPNEEAPDPYSGMVFGAGDLTSSDWIDRELPMYVIDRGESRKLGSRTVSECMNSGAAAYLNSLLGLGSRIQSNSSACITGSEALMMGYEYLQLGYADRMLCGSTEGDGKYIWGAFDAMRVLCMDSNENPSHGSRPMNTSSAGFVPSGGAGALVLETLESAQKRGATIYSEILGGHFNSGGQRGAGTMTAPNSEAVVTCIQTALKKSDVKPEEIDLISGHLTSTKGDSIEVRNWVNALGRKGKNFPFINSPKSMLGHALSAAGSIETIACVLQMEHNFIHPSLNTNEVHPKILAEIDEHCIPKETIEKEVNTVVKSNFGFGDLNCVVILKKYKK